MTGGIFSVLWRLESVRSMREATLALGYKGLPAHRERVGGWAVESDTGNGRTEKLRRCKILGD